MWCQHAKVNWVKQGDLSTAFFYRIANIRNKKNTNFKLDVDNTPIKVEKQIREVIDDHFKKLFGTKNSTRWQGNVSYIIPPSSQNSYDSLFNHFFLGTD